MVPAGTPQDIATLLHREIVKTLNTSELKAAGVARTRPRAGYSINCDRQMAAAVWALENPSAGIVEADEMDFHRCLEGQMPYLGPVIGTYTDWTSTTK